MTDHAVLPERFFGLSVADGCRTVRPGTPVSFRLRIRNARSIATPPARVFLRIPAGWSAPDALHADLPAIDPSGAYETCFTARPDVADERTRLSRVQAELQVDNLVFGSNIVCVAVNGRASFCPPASRVRIECVERDVFRVVAEIVNAGDAVARNVQIDVPPPPGFAPDDATTSPVFAEVPPGITAGFTYTIRPVAPVSEQVATGAAVVTFDGTRAASLASVPCALTPEIAVPVVEARRTADRLDAVVRIRNDGWLPARDVPCFVALPPGWRVVRGALLAGCAPARSRRDSASPNGIAVMLPFIAARGSLELTFVAYAVRGGAGPLSVRCAGHLVEEAIPPLVVRAFQIDARAGSAFVEPGSIVPIVVDVMNAGESGENVTIVIDGATCWTDELRSGAAARATGHAAISADLRGGRQPVQITAIAGDGTVLASTTLDLSVHAVPAIAREESPENAPSQPDRVQLDAVLEMPEAIASGARLDIRLRCVARSVVAAVRVRQQLPPGAVYVAGSTSVNGYAVVDDAAGAPLAGDGLAFYDLPAGIEACVTWSLLPRGAGELELTVAIEANGNPLTTLVRTVNIVAAPAFGIRPQALPFHIDATTIDDRTPNANLDFVDEGVHDDDVGPLWDDDSRERANDAANTMHDNDRETMSDGGETIHGCDDNPAPDETVLTLGLTRHADRDERLRRVLHGSRGPGILGHLPAIAVLFPDFAAVDDAHVDDALATAGDAVRNVFQKLFVKLRIPGYDVAVADLEDATARRKLVAFLDSVIALESMRPRAPNAETVVRSLDRERLRSLRAALSRAPIGGAAALAVLTALLPADDPDAIEPLGQQTSTEDALRSYVAMLQGAIAALGTPDDAAFIRAIAGTSPPALDRARQSLLSVLESHAALESQTALESQAAVVAR